MARRTDFLDLWKISLETTRMTAQAQTVIALRLAGAAGLWTLAPGEAVRMVAEKQRAAGQSAAGAWAAMAAGRRPDQVYAAALRPFTTKTGSNARRLSKSALRQSLRRARKTPA